VENGDGEKKEGQNIDPSICELRLMPLVSRGFSARTKHLVPVYDAASVAESGRAASRRYIP